MPKKKHPLSMQPMRTDATYRLHMARLANHLMLVEGVSWSRTAKYLGVSEGVLDGWVRALPRWERRERELAQRMRERARTVKSNAATRARYRADSLQQVRKSLQRGLTVDEAVKENNLSKSAVAAWLFDEPFDALCRYALLGESWTRELKIEVPTKPEQWLDQALKTWELDWSELVNQPRPELPSLVRKAQAEVREKYDMNRAQRLALKNALRGELIMQDVLERIDRLMLEELRGTPGAEQALYDWQRMFAKLATEVRLNLREAGLLQAPVEIGDDDKPVAFRRKVRIPDAAE